jgi:DNA-binding response OmpR family regulator
MNKKILIADDDPAIVESLEMLLSDEGYDVTTTVNGQTVREVIGELPDLIILDIWMSGEDGRHICKLLKTQLHTKEIPVIMISANRDAETLAHEAGANSFISKPFEAEHLLREVDLQLNPTS